MSLIINVSSQNYVNHCKSPVIGEIVNRDPPLLSPTLSEFQTRNLISLSQRNTAALFIYEYFNYALSPQLIPPPPNHPFPSTPPPPLRVE